MGKPLTCAQSSQSFKWVRFVAIALLMLAISFRFTHLDRKVYWHDESYTSLVITAHPGRFFSDDLFRYHQVVKPADLLAFHSFDPSLTLTDMLVRKGTEDAQHPPMYYLLLRFWTQLWGTTPAIARGFSSLLSLLVFPALYWLCLELFESHLSAWVAIALLALSPFHLVYGQETREFEFWTALIVGSSALLLRSLRSPGWRTWALYGLSMTAAFYTSLFSVCVAIGHFAYVVLIDLFTDSDNSAGKLPLKKSAKQSVKLPSIGKRTILCFTTLVFVALLFSPWMYCIITAREMVTKTASWVSASAPFITYVQTLIFNFSRSFVDFNFEFSNGFAYLLAIPLLLLQGYSMYLLCRHAPKKVWLFVITFGGSTALLLGLPDLLFASQMFIVARYAIPCYIGFHLAIVFLITTYLTQVQRWKSNLAKLIFSSLILLGVLSCSVYAQSDTWWNKQLSSNYHQLAEVINQSDRPLIATNSDSYYPVSTVSLSYLLQPEAQFLLLSPIDKTAFVQALPKEAKTIFLFNLPEASRHQFEAFYQQQFSRAFQDPWNEVWQLKL